MSFLCQIKKCQYIYIEREREREREREENQKIYISLWVIFQCLPHFKIIQNKAQWNKIIKCVKIKNLNLKTNWKQIKKQIALQ